MKQILVLICRHFAGYSSFFRLNPVFSNIYLMMFECSNFALSIGFVALRLLKLALISSFYVGRVDTPFLAPGVGRVGPLELDNYPHIFLKDILAHEAHRHP